MARYFLKFRHSDTGLTPTFTTFKKVADLSVVTPPTPVVEVGFGEYYFDYTPTFDITFEVDGGASIPTEEVRYIADTISPRDIYLDEPISQVKTDVWTDSTSYAAGQKGKRVDQLGDPTDASSATTMFGKELLYKESIRGDSAGGSDGDSIKLALDRVMGGTGYGGTGVDVKTVNDNLAADEVNILAIKAKTDNLPASPASTGDITSAVTSIKGGSNIDNTQLDTLGLAIKAKTDLLPSDPASQATTGTAIANAVSSIKGADVRDLTQIAGTGFVSGDSLVGIEASITGLVAPDNTSIAAIKVETDKIGDAANASGANTVFGKTYAARDAVMGADARDLTQIAGTGFNAATMSLAVVHDTLLRVAGMLHENSVLDGTVFDGNNNLTAGRLRLYDSKANADAALGVPWPGVYNTGKIAEYYIQATYVGSNLQTYEVSKVP